eukprot:SAG11_NODE_1436_length_4909_cov_3.825780_3_plen_157_part_00
MEFEITSIVEVGGAMQPQISVNRRFRQFDALRKKLIKQYPNLPYLPSKTWNRHGGVESAAKSSFGVGGQGSGGNRADKKLAALHDWLQALQGQTRDDHGFLHEHVAKPIVEFLGALPHLLFSAHCLQAPAAAFAALIIKPRPHTCHSHSMALSGLI